MAQIGFGNNRGVWASCKEKERADCRKENEIKCFVKNMRNNPRLGFYFVFFMVNHLFTNVNHWFIRKLVIDLMTNYWLISYITPWLPSSIERTRSTLLSWWGVVSKRIQFFPCWLSKLYSWEQYFFGFLCFFCGMVNFYDLLVFQWKNQRIPVILTIIKGITVVASQYHGGYRLVTD